MIVIKRFYLILIMSAFAVFSLINMSGWGEAHNSAEMLRYFIYILAAACFFSFNHKNKKIARHKALFVFVMVFVMEGTSTLSGNSGMGIMFLSFYLVTYIVSMQRCDDANLFFISVVYLVFGTGLLFIMKNGSTLSGWNQNTIAIICFQSFLTFQATFEAETLFKKWLYGICLVLNVVLFETLDCRSAMMCIVIAGILKYKKTTAKNLLDNKRFVLFGVLMPLIVAVFVVCLSKMPVAEALNSWSVSHFKKTIFNGRDVIWGTGFERFKENPVFGHGYINSGYWHNSAVACLYSYGAVGYCLYVAAFYKLLTLGYDYTDDAAVRNIMMAFIILNFQQSFENTLFNIIGVYMPFILLGVLAGRVRYLKSLEEGKLSKW